LRDNRLFDFLSLGVPIYLGHDLGAHGMKTFENLRCNALIARGRDHYLTL